VQGTRTVFDIEETGMGTFPVQLTQHFATHHGVVAVCQLRELGVSLHEQDKLVADRVIAQVHRGVYRLMAVPCSFEANCLAACVADDELVIAGVSAARLWRFKHTNMADVVVASVAHDRTPVSRGVVLRRTNVMDDADIVVRPDGIRVTGPARTWFDRACELSDRYFESLTEQLLDDFCTLPTLFDTARRLSSRGRAGSARVRRVLSHRSAWQRPADSELELRVLRALESYGIVLIRQYPLRLRNGVTIHLDGADPVAKWGVEVDHLTWHGGRFEAQADKARDRGARRIGWQIDRITDQECREHFDRSIRELVDLYRQRTARAIS
jgi:very-short-patch-repair endonuclease